MKKQRNYNRFPYPKDNMNEEETLEFYDAMDKWIRAQEAGS